MRTDEDNLWAAHRNFVGSFEKLVEHQPGGSTRRFGSVFAFVSRLPVALFNGLVLLEPTGPSDLDAAADWLHAAEMPHEAFLRQPASEEPAKQLEARGFERRPWVQPVMEIVPPLSPPRPRGGVSVRAVVDEAGLAEHVDHMIASGNPEPMVRSLYTPAFAFDPEVRLFTGYLDGRPMGNAIAIRTGETSGVYAVGTRPEARGRGLGTAATWAAIDAGRQWGCARVVLQSSEMGFGVYSAMGFQVIDRLVLLRARSR